MAITLGCSFFIKVVFPNFGGLKHFCLHGSVYIPPSTMVDKNPSVSYAILDIIHRNNGSVPQAVIINSLDYSRQWLYSKISDLEDADMIDVDRSDPSGNILQMKKRCLGEGGWLPSTLHGGGDEGEGRGMVDLHNVSVRFSMNIPESRWAEVVNQVADADGMSSYYDRDQGSGLVVADSWRVRFTGGHCIIRLLDSVRGNDPFHLRDRGIARIFKARDKVNSRLPNGVSIGNNPVEFNCKVHSSHIALCGDPFSELVDRWSSLDLDDIVIRDEEGRERLWLDNSNGDHHLEAGYNPHGNKWFAEEDIQFIRDDLYGWLISNKDKWREMRGCSYVEDRDLIMGAIFVLLKEIVWDSDGCVDDDPDGSDNGSCNSLYTDDEEKQLKAKGLDSVWW